jgi:hypothetical protein
VRARSYILAEGALICATIAAGTSCVIAREATGTAAQDIAATDWDLFNVADTNGDGLSDLLWWSPSTRQLEVWLMRGTHVFARGHPIPGPPGDGWRPVVSVDFNHDGMSDLVWTNPARGTMTVWLLSATDLLQAGAEIEGPAGPGWVVAAAGDVDGDGLADVAWHNASGRRLSLWLMRGTTVRERGPTLLAPGHAEHVLNDLGDVNGDGLSDIVWTEPRTNRMDVWLLDGTRQLEPGVHTQGPIGAGWGSSSLADFNHDGLDDVLWANDAANSMAVWLLEGTRVLEGGPEIPGPPGDGWSVAFANDVDGDGMADVAWQNRGKGLFTIWLMNGTEVLERGPILEGPGGLATGP